MEGRIQELLAKYWEGNTSLDEEKELRILLRKEGTSGVEKEFFAGLDQLSKKKPRGLKQIRAKYKPQSFIWKAAAVFVGFALCGSLLYRQHQQNMRRDAYEQVMDAFALIQHHMARGTGELGIMKEFRHLNAPNDIFDFNDLNERQ